MDLGRGCGDDGTVWELKFIHHLPVFVGLPLVSDDDRRGAYRVVPGRAAGMEDFRGDVEVIGGAVGDVLGAFHDLIIPFLLRTLHSGHRVFEEPLRTGIIGDNCEPPTGGFLVVEGSVAEWVSTAGSYGFDNDQLVGFDSIDVWGSPPIDTWANGGCVLTIDQVTWERIVCEINFDGYHMFILPCSLAILHRAAGLFRIAIPQPRTIISNRL